MFLRAIQLNPRYSTARHWYAMSCLVPMARLDEALEQMLLAQSLDPVSSIIASDVAVTHYYRRDFEAALEQCDHTIELNPHFAPAYLTLGMIQEQRKDFDESAAAFRRAVDLAPNSLRMQSALARTLALSGKRERAIDALRTLADDGLDALRVAVGIHDDGVCRRRSGNRVSLADEGRATTAASSCSPSRWIRDSTGCATIRDIAAVAGRVGLASARAVDCRSGQAPSTTSALRSTSVCIHALSHSSRGWPSVE